MYNRVVVGMAEYWVSSNPEDVLCILGLGSCVGLCLYDPRKKIGGMVHILLPESIPGQSNPFKFADSAVPALWEKVKSEGASPENIFAKISGGAKMFSGTDSLFDIGRRNVEAVKAELQKLKIPLRADDTGGNRGRSIMFYLEDGRLEKKTIGQKPVVV